MVCNKPCEYRRDAIRLSKRIEALESGLEIDKLQKKFEAEQHARLSAVNSRDRLRHTVEEKDREIKKLKIEKKALNERIEFLQETERSNKKAADKAARAQAKQIDQLKKALSTEEWRTEKVRRDLTEKHNKEIRKLRKEHESQLAEMDRKHQEELAEKDAVIAQLTGRHQNKTGKSSDQEKSGKPNVNGTKADSRTSSVPPSLDPNHPTITNGRKPSGRKPGGQKGHKAHLRKRYKPTNVIELDPPQEVLDHPEDYYCIDTKARQVVSVELNIVVTEYRAKVYRHHKTRAVIHSDFPEGVGHLEVN